MTLDEALTSLTDHMTGADLKPEPIRDPADAISRISACVSKAAAEHNSGEDADKAGRFGRRIAQGGALCLRTLVDLKIPDSPICPGCGEPLK